MIIKDFQERRMTLSFPVPPPVEDSGEDFAAMFASHGASSERLHPGQKVSGVIIAITGENVFLDVGVKVDGVMERKDLLDAEGLLTADVGDTVEAWVAAVHPQEVRLSRSMSGSGAAALEEARDAGTPVDGRVVGVCKGGYAVDVSGRRAFCPGSQMDMAPVADAESMVGRTLRFLIARVENGGRNVVVSRRLLQEREREENLAAALDSLKEGNTVEGRITRLAPFGAFMEVAPSVEGMIHVSELSWSRVGSPDEAVSLGDCVRAKVLSVAQDAKGNTRISLSRRQAEGDPWAAVEGRLEPGAVVEGRVTRLAPFGAFVEVLPGVEGLAHVSEMSWTRRVAKPEEVVCVGDVVSVKIKEFSLDRRRLSLSLRDAEGDPWAQAAERFPVGSQVAGTVEGRAQFGLFVALEPGIVGLLPNAALKNSHQAQAFSKLDKGDGVIVTVQSVDAAQRRISLVPEGGDVGEDASWKKHASPVSKSGMGLLGQALQTAMQKKK